MTVTQRIAIVTILVLALLRLTLLHAAAQAGATEYQLLQQAANRQVNLPAQPMPICYSFDQDGHSTRALTRYDGLAWYIQIDTRFSFVVACGGYTWSRIDSRFNVIALTPAFAMSQTAYHDPQGLPHDVSATVCRYAPRLGISFCYTPALELSVEPDGAWWSTMVTDGWEITTTRVDGVRYNEYTLLTRTPDGRVITDPSDPSEFSPACWSFDGMGNSTRALVRWDTATHTWRIRISEAYHFALVCDDRQWTVIEDADRGMPGAIIILDTSPMSSVMVYEDRDRQPVVVTATACYTNRWHRMFCYDAVVSLDADDDGARYWVNVNDGWALTVMTEQQGATSGRVTQ